MQITEIEWLKAHREEVSEDDIRELDKMGVFQVLDTGQLEMPARKAIHWLGELGRIVSKYMG